MDRVDITRRRVVGGLATVGLGSVATGAGTSALLRDRESSTNNSIESGTIALSFGNNGSFAISATLEPGQSTRGSVTLVNSGSLAGSVDVNVSYAENDGSTTNPDKTADEVAQVINVVTLTYGGTDVSGQIVDVDGNGTDTLFDLANSDSETDGDDIVDLADPGAGTDFTIELEIATGVGNTYDGEGIDITVSFDLNQRDSQ